MKKHYLLVLGGITTLTLGSTAYAAAPNNNNPNTFLGPIARVSFNNTLSPSSALSLAGEASYQNIRFDGTMGWKIWDNQRIKLSAEYLLQNISFGFFSGYTSQWVHQGAIGVRYQYALGEYLFLFNPELNIDAYASHAPSKSLRVDTGTFVNNNGIITPYTDNKRLAGTNAAGISPGFSLEPWEGTHIGANLHYDSVSYDTSFYSASNGNGFGGSAFWQQLIANDVEVKLAASMRQPFNHYQAHLTWLDVPCYGDWSLGINGAYTIGKNKLPSTYAVGLSADYLLDQSHATSMAQRQEALNFLRWANTPSVEMPQVLAIPNERVS